MKKEKPKLPRGIHRRKKSNHPSPSCVVKVGDGRGFIIKQRVKTVRPKGLRENENIKLRTYIERRLIVTAGHCLPKLPRANAGGFTSDVTYGNLVGALDGGKNNLWAEVLFVDPVADLAVLGCTDNQELCDEAEAFEGFIESLRALCIGKATSGPGWMLTLDQKWVPIRLEVHARRFGVGLEIDAVEAGQSGSPILNDEGCAVGVVVIGSGTPTHKKRSGPQPILTRDLPAWLVPGR